MTRLMVEPEISRASQVLRLRHQVVLPRITQRHAPKFQWVPSASCRCSEQPTMRRSGAQGAEASYILSLSQHMTSFSELSIYGFNLALA